MNTDKKNDWIIVKESTYESFPIFTLKKSIRINPRSNKQIEFVRIDGLDWVNTIALTANNEMVLVEQFRHGSNQWTIELPGGCVNSGEDPQHSAKRELEEETGFSCDKLEFLGRVRPNPALMSNYCSFYIARNAYYSSSQKLDSGEDIKVQLKPVSKVFEMLDAGEIDHALMVAALGIFKSKIYSQASES